MYVWIEAVLGYVTATMKYCEENSLNWEDYWKNEDATIYMVHGKDNITFHSIILPSLLFSIGSDYKLPDKMVSCEYLNINDEKISKSKGNGITILDLVDDYSSDSIRYYFLCNGPEKKDSNFSMDEFKAVHNSDLVNKFGNFVNRTLKFKGLEKIDKGNIENEIKSNIIETYEKVSNYIVKLEFRNAIQEILGLVEFGNKYYDDKKPWVLYKENSDEFNNVMYNCVYIIANLANLFEPILPKTADKLAKYLNIDISNWNEVEVNNSIIINEEIQPLFDRIK